MKNYLFNKIKWSCRKNLFDLQGFLLKSYPDFIFQRHPNSIRGIIPVFVFHSVEAGKLTEQLEFLHDNNYRTLMADQLHDVLVGNSPVPDNAVVLTFDDGLGSMWTVAYPLLKKYGFQAISFLIPGLISEGTHDQPNLEDVWNGRALLDDIANRDYSQAPLATWKEISIMHKSGLIDFQAHTMYHNLVFTSPKVIDFIHPDFDYYKFGNINVPIYSDNGAENVTRTGEMGMPLYESEPFLAGKLRFYDDEDLRRKCIEFVKERGEGLFFNKSGWRDSLYSFFKTARRQNGTHEWHESKKEQFIAIESDLRKTKELIQSHLNDKTVRHLCYPWYIGSQLACELSQKTGYISNFWGHLRDVVINSRGKNPFRISRLEDIYIIRLPGKNRKHLKDILVQKIRGNINRITKNSPIL
jgi:hypothetical protein